MPNRILKDSIRTSDSINNLTWFEEVLFYRLMVSCDDYGRFDGRPAIIKGSCFPLKSVTDKQIKDALNKLSSAGIVYTYEVEAKPYLQIVAWEKHQNIRAKRSKYPEPTKKEFNCENMNASEFNCMHMHADVPVIQSNPNPNTNANAESYISSDREASLLADVESIPLNDGSEWSCTEEDLEEYVRLYPCVDVMQEFRNMRAWCKSNPSKRKTRKGIKRFVNSWLSRQQDQGGGKSYRSKDRIDEVDSW